MKQTLYCYVDETGQDTKGVLFVATVIIPQNNREKLREQLEKIEFQSGKGKRKWFHASRDKKEAYIKAVIANNLFKRTIFYGHYKDTKTYVDLTILTIAQAIFQRAKKNYKAYVIVDGLKKSERQKFATGLRKLNVRIRKVKGEKDENDALIRLADAMAGFIRDYLEGDLVMTKLYEQAVKSNIIQQV